MERKENTEIIATIDVQNKITDVNILENSINVQSSNASGGNATAAANEITGNAVNEISKTDNGKSADKNKFTTATADENEIINQIQAKNKFGY